MTKRYEYLVCQAQNGRVTFVNGQWQGSLSLGGADSEQALQSCPEVWTYLAQEGQSGWELVAVIDHVDGQGAYERLYLKRVCGPPPVPPQSPRRS